jgi:hypothetical protein
MKTITRATITSAKKASTSPVIAGPAELFEFSEVDVVDGGARLEFVVDVLEDEIVCVDDELEVVVDPRLPVLAVVAVVVVAELVPILEVDEPSCTVMLTFPMDRKCT